MYITTLLFFICLSLALVLSVIVLFGEENIQPSMKSESSKEELNSSNPENKAEDKGMEQAGNAELSQLNRSA